MTVAVLTPYRMADGKAGWDLLERCIHEVAQQDYPDFVHLVYPNRYPPHPQKYGNGARACNTMQDMVFGAVWWVDADVVKIPPDTLSKLVAYSKQLGDAIVQPMVHIEPVGNEYDNLFYDTGTCCTISGQWATNMHGIPGNDPLERMKYVGCGMYVPAYWSHRARFEPVGDDIEKLSYLDTLRELFAVEMYAARDLRIDHANLPAYGFGWH